MIRGLEIFNNYFKEHKDKYILIGGAACDLWFDNAGGNFRSTKDLDIILVVELLDKSFFSIFWEFIKKGKYSDRQIESKRRKYYRFRNPAETDFPFQIELFSRKPESIKIPESSHLTLIPSAEDISSLSAIIIEDEYYNFIKNNKQVLDDFSVLNIAGLIALKIKAFFDLINRKTDNTLDREISKHRNDVIRLTSLLAESDKIQTPQKIKNNIEEFLINLDNISPNYKDLNKDLKSNGIESNLSTDYLKTKFRSTFGLI